jgi:hypothetical protein
MWCNYDAALRRTSRRACFVLYPVLPVTHVPVLYESPRRRTWASSTVSLIEPPLLAQRRRASTRVLRRLEPEQR